MSPYPPIAVPSIAPEELTPTVAQLLRIIEHYQHTVITLEQRVATLEAEVRRVKNLPPRPNLKPSALDKKRDDDDPPPPGVAANAEKRKRRAVKRRKKQLKIHRSVVIEPPNVPPGSRFRGYHDFNTSLHSRVRY